MRQQGRQILPKAIREKERGTVGGQDLRDVVDKALRHGQRAIPDVKREQELLSGSIATQTYRGHRSRRSMASAPLTAPSFTALSRAKS